MPTRKKEIAEKTELRPTKKKDVAGKIKFIHRTGYGFVRRNDNDEVVYIPRSELRRTPSLRHQDLAVIFDVETARMGPRAINLRTYTPEPVNTNPSELPGNQQPLAH